ncbi:MAG: Gfo/Idh/MocA family oxidoreductase [Nitrospirae bacterium]|nr:Gfo/Idh/MocA family oxidoreductase [Magnetococcales bacterium]HAT50325.1 gfo/Idh/MocA family oxidoreductase [Alphaproteobacteria bacterium]
MRVVIVGLGIQGKKRLHFAGKDAVATVDTHTAADFSRLEDLPSDRYDAALLCVPDQPKMALIRHLIAEGKHFLVEKPLFSESDDDLSALALEAQQKGVVGYTAYNHRFEPHLIRLKEVIENKSLGRIFRIRMFYGNGTARDVRDSLWRDQEAGVLPDLGSHLLDLLLFLFGHLPEPLSIQAARRFENKAFDHILCIGQGDILVELEMSLLSWRNHFVAEVYGEKGSAHISSLCKWGPSTLTLHERVLPSGRPPSHAITLTQPDPTWALEYNHFKGLVQRGSGGNLANDVEINRVLNRLRREALARFPL